MRKASYALCFGWLESGKFTYPRHCSIDAHGVYFMYMHFCALVQVHTVWASVLLVRIQGQYQSLNQRNSSNVVPLFCCVNIGFVC